MAATNALRSIFAKACEGFGAELRACDGEDDHVHLLVEYPPTVGRVMEKTITSHLLVEYPPTVAIPSLVNSLKSVSSRLLGLM